MKIKHFPSTIAQTMFVDSKLNKIKMNNIDLEVFYSLLYISSKNASKPMFQISHIELKDFMGANNNTTTIKASLEKLSELHIVHNCLCSYGDKEPIKTKPFTIDFTLADNGKSYGVKIKSDQDFIKSFDNPTPFVSVDYDELFSLNKMSKLVYILLKDALGNHKNKNRIIPLTDLRELLNVDVDTANKTFISQLKKSLEDIKLHTSMNIKFDTILKMNINRGQKEITEIKFFVNGTDKQPKQKVQKTKINKPQKESVQVDQYEEESNDVVEDNTPEINVEDKIKEEVEKRYKKAVKDGIVIDNPPSYKKGIEKGVRSEGLEYKMLIDAFNDEHRAWEISNGFQPTATPELLCLTFDGKTKDDLKDIYFINNDYLLESTVDGNTITSSAQETHEYISTHHVSGHLGGKCSQDLMSKIQR